MLSSFQEFALATISSTLETRALPYTYLRTVTSQEKLALLIKTEDDQQRKIFLNLLLQFKTKLTANNQRYNPPEASPLLAPIQELLESLNPSQMELRAAVWNLKGLIEHLIEKKYEAAIRSYSTALEDDSKLVTSTRVSLSVNLASVYTEQKQFEKAKAELGLLNVAQYYNDFPENNRIIAAIIYSDMAVNYLGLKDQKYLECYRLANKLWPESNVLANIMSISLSKINSGTPKECESADEILSNYTETAINNHYFVNLYYRADIHIKLAAFQERGSDPFNFYVVAANQFLSLARGALSENKNYSDNYKFKSQARLARLENNLAMVKGEVILAKLARQEAEEKRQPVLESREKKEKFMMMINRVPLEAIANSVGLNPSALFRRPCVEMIPEEKEETALLMRKNKC